MKDGLGMLQLRRASSGQRQDGLISAKDSNSALHPPDASDLHSQLEALERLRQQRVMHPTFLHPAALPSPSSRDPPRTSTWRCCMCDDAVDNVQPAAFPNHPETHSSQVHGAGVPVMQQQTGCVGESGADGCSVVCMPIQEAEQPSVPSWLQQLPGGGRLPLSAVPPLPDTLFPLRSDSAASAATLRATGSMQQQQPRPAPAAPPPPRQQHATKAEPVLAAPLLSHMSSGSQQGTRSAFLMQQPSSKLWMEAVPVR